MVEGDRLAFVQAISRLVVALREPEPDGVLLRTYFAALHDVEIEFLLAAADRLIGHAQWFPKTSEWRAEAARVEKERVEAQRELLRKLPAPLCLECLDSGWREDASAPVKVLKAFQRNREGTVEAVSVAPGRAPVRRCECQKLRRLELLGRLPSPASYRDAAAPSLGNDELSPDEAASLKTLIERRTGLAIVPRGMPQSWAAKMARRADRDDDHEAEVSNG